MKKKNIRYRKSMPRASSTARVRKRKHTATKTTSTPKGPLTLFLYGLALAALGGGGYLIYQRIKTRRMNQATDMALDNEEIIPNAYVPEANASPQRSSSTSTGDAFPLTKGSRGSRVRALQQALSKSSPSLKVDGILGAKTIRALKAAGYPDIVDETLFRSITGNGKVTITFDPSSLASSLYQAARATYLTGVLNILKQLTTMRDYAAVNEYYKKQRFIARTIVTDLLEYAFKQDEKAKAQLRQEFLRIGLKLSDTGQWSLEGFRLFNDLITLRPTVVIDKQGQRIPVQTNTILGDEVTVADGMTWFRSVDNTILQVPSQDVTYARGR